jgi:hypothetical protein
MIDGNNVVRNEIKKMITNNILVDVCCNKIDSRSFSLLCDGSGGA